MVQIRATRWILSSCSPYQSVTELQQQFNMRTLEQRWVDAKAIMLCKIIHGLVAIHIPSYFEQPMRSTRHTHHRLALRQIHTTANHYNSSFFPSTVVYWNQLTALSAQWLSCRVLDSRPKGCGFEPHQCHCVLSSSKTH